MVYKCCVPNCRGNYDEGSKVHIFRFPSDGDLKNKWISAIKREHFIPNKNSVVCELHFHQHEIRRDTDFHCENGQIIKVPLKVPRLTPGAIPSLLPNCPAYMSTSRTYRESPQQKRKRREGEQVQTAINESLEESHLRETRITFSNLEELKNKVIYLSVGDSWDILHKDKNVMILKIMFNPGPEIISSVTINESLEVSVFYKHTKLDSIGNYHIPRSVKNLDQISMLVDKINTLSSQVSSTNTTEILDLAIDLLRHASVNTPHLREPFEFMIEQIALWSRENRSYSPSFLILSSMLHSISPHSYSYLRHLNLVYLPHPCTLRRLSSSLNLDPRIEQHDGNFLQYIRDKFTGEYNDKFIVLMMDEIHVKPIMDYKGGNVVGKAFNSERLATGAYCFMVSSLLSDFKEIAHVLPVKSMTGEHLHGVLKKVILGLEEVGFHVVCIVSDNSAVNRKCMQLFSPDNELKCVYPHPADEDRPLFFVFDSVHLLKCIRNNWLSQKDEDMCMNYPDFEYVDNGAVKHASFHTIKKLYALEQEKFVKYGYGLSLKALNPSSFEKQNVKLALQVFNENVIEGLNVLGEKHNLVYCNETVVYIRIILDWWAVVNVKTPGKGARLNHTLMFPLSSSSVEGLAYLNKFLQWLVKWRNLNLKGSLSAETMTALIVTTKGFLTLVEYCLSKLNFSYVLLGKFQTDLLEDRFGKYRQLAGGQYNISVRQLFEVEKKLRLQSSMSLKIKSNAFGEIEVPLTEFCEPSLEPSESVKAGDSLIMNVCRRVTVKDIESCNDDIPILVYLAGYCCFSVSKFLKCEYCKEILVTEEFIDVDDEAYNLIRNKSRGRLLFPEMFVVDIIVHNYVVVTKLCTDFEAEFLSVNNHREVVCDSTMKIIHDKELLWEPDVCNNGHSSEYVCKKLVWSSTNILLNNYCKKRSSLSKSDLTRKRAVFCQK